MEEIATETSPPKDMESENVEEDNGAKCSAPAVTGETTVVAAVVEEEGGEEEEEGVKASAEVVKEEVLEKEGDNVGKPEEEEEEEAKEAKEAKDAVVVTSSSVEEDVAKNGVEEERSEVAEEVEKVEEEEEELEEDVDVREDCETVTNPPNSEAAPPKNYKNVILEDWDIDVPQSSAKDDNNSSNTAESGGNLGNNNNNNNDVSNNNNNNNESSNVDEGKDVVVSRNNNNIEKQEVPTALNSDAENRSEAGDVSKSREEEAGSEKAVESIIKPVLDKKKNPLKYSNLIVSNQDIVEILDSSVERVCRPIIPAKDIFLSIELTKHLHQKLNPPILVGKKAASATEPTERPAAEGTRSGGAPAEEIKSATDQQRKGKKKPGKKLISIGDELERTIALRQLRDEFPSTRKKSHAKKKVNHIPFLASSVLEKALTASPSGKSTAMRRRPCYLPENSAPGDPENPAGDKKNGAEAEATQPEEVDAFPAAAKDSRDLSNHSSSSVPVVRTYCIKRKSTESDADVISAIQSFVSGTEEGSDRNEGAEFKPKKQKTAQQAGKTQKKSKTEMNRKRNELEMLLGDEGAVRMLYDTQHKDEAKPQKGKKSRIKTQLGLKKDLMLKTKLVKNAVLRLSGVGVSDGVSLRGKRRPAKTEAPKDADSFIASAPNVIFYKAKKKQRAEASRILYRHSSSESFDSGDECRRGSSDALDSTNAESNLANGEPFKEAEAVVSAAAETTDSAKKGKPQRKAGAGGAGAGAGAGGGGKGDSVNSKLVWSNVPVRKSSRPRVVSKKYSIWASTSMDSLSVESLGLKKPKRASQELGKKLNYKELRILQHGNLVEVILAPTSTVLKSSLNEQVMTELREAFEFLASQDTCNVILLTSNGTTFCQGIDLNYVLSVEEDDRKFYFGNLLTSLKALVLCLAKYKKPIIAGVHAAAIGLGVTLLSYCDVVVSSDTATFYAPYARLGQVCEGAATVTFPRINRNLVTELLFKSEKLSATDALKHGLVSQVIPEERFEEELMLVSKRVASYSVQAMQSMKSLASKCEFEKIAETLDAECELILEHWCSNECINNIIKFLNSGEVQFRHLDVT